MKIIIGLILIRTLIEKILKLMIELVVNILNPNPQSKCILIITLLIFNLYTYSQSKEIIINNGEVSSLIKFNSTDIDTNVIIKFNIKITNHTENSIFLPKYSLDNNYLVDKYNITSIGFIKSQLTGPFLGGIIILRELKSHESYTYEFQRTYQKCEIEKVTTIIGCIDYISSKHLKKLNRNKLKLLSDEYLKKATYIQVSVNNSQ